MRLLNNKSIFALFVFVVLDSSLSFGDQSGCASLFDAITEIDRALDGNSKAQEALKEVTKGIEKLQKELEEAQKNSLIDPLTNLPNLRALNERIPSIISQARRDKKEIWILMMDGDNFKKINDTYGHGMGDIYLKLLGGILKNNLRGNDHIFRNGGDEFIGVILTESREEALVAARRISRAVKSASWPKEILLSLSIGMSRAQLDLSKFHEAKEEADQTLYSLKHNGGKGKIKIFGEDTYHEAD